MRKNLLGWQWTLYAPGHRDRLSLLLHIATVPLFRIGTAMLLWAILGSAGAALSGPALRRQRRLAEGVA